MKEKVPVNRLVSNIAGFVSLPRHLPALAALPLMLGAMLFLSLHNIDAATFPVSNLNDSGSGSLRYAITNANATAGTNTITFDVGVTGTITLTSGQLGINNHVNIMGPGSATLAVSGNDINRVFRMTSGRTVLISGLTIRNGRAVDTGAGGSDAGGGIQSVGNLTLSNCVVRNNSSVRTGSGGILSQGSLILYNCVVSSNSVTAFPGSYSSGGGIQTFGPTSLFNCVVSGNTLTTEAGTPGFSTATLFGGGIAHSDNVFGALYDVLTLSNTIVSGNASVGAPQVSAQGGGIYSDSAALIINSTVSGNSATGGAGTNTAMGASGNGSGGGLYFSSTVAAEMIIGSTISGNSAVGGNGTGDANGGGGFGGGFYGGSIRLTNCTVSGNIAIGGASQSADGGDAEGGGLFFTGFSGSNLVVNSTITLNAVTIGIGSTGNGVGAGGGIFREATPVILQSTIVAQNTATGLGQDIRNSNPTTGSFNLIGDGDFSGVVNGANNNQAGTSGSPLDPKLGPLQNNGGPTKTHALLATSPAIDKGIAGGIATDQRGVARPVDDPAVANASGGDGTDIGAFELTLAGPTLAIVRAGNQATISWSPNTAGFGLQERTNLVLGTWINSPSGATNPITIPATLRTKFYRLFKP